MGVSVTLIKTSALSYNVSTGVRTATTSEYTLTGVPVLPLTAKEEQTARQKVSDSSGSYFTGSFSKIGITKRNISRSEDISIEQSDKFVIAGKTWSVVTIENLHNGSYSVMLASKDAA
jgi:hypothetical protein